MHLVQRRQAKPAASACICDKLTESQNACGCSIIRQPAYESGGVTVSKVTVVGSGNVGATVAQYVAGNDLADVVLVDIIEGMPQGKALDLYQAAPILGHGRKVFGSNDYADTKGSDIIVITAGIARKPGMSRDDLLKTNAQIVQGVARETAKHSPDAIFIVVTN